MKKPTISPAAFAHELAAIAVDLIEIVRRQADHAVLVDVLGDDPGTWPAEFFSTPPAEAAPARGRGERAEVIVGWVWPAEGAAHAAAALVRARIAAIPGVDEVSDPELDPQFKLIWSVRAIIRVTQ